ncbi:hypothetical protein J7F01_41235 [Streptomyces sp. ISL-22]|uniref:hypothetical protein n=1 Tax=unclassified Streptomyces TaxID=2593676 RepID=UPI001BEB7BC9|nr:MULTISPECIES: hypothetical protein [unclassified Streptomyces]MBT2423442.1 hypothetical protein [Streptomyces sp. ISL-24]MBT2438415.1 hypothetical protein [Streptomyces sp. ISL-22]
MTVAPAAHAASENYIQITNNGWFVANTCFTWRDAEQRNYCNNARPIGNSWKAYFPAEATGAIVDLSIWPGYTAKASAAITETGKNHCFEISGTALNPTLLETGC